MLVVGERSDDGGVASSGASTLLIVEPSGGATIFGAASSGAPTVPVSVASGATILAWRAAGRRRCSSSNRPAERRRRRGEQRGADGARRRLASGATMAAREQRGVDGARRRPSGEATLLAWRTAGVYGAHRRAVRRSDAIGAASSGAPTVPHGQRGAGRPGRSLGGPIAHAQAHSRLSARTGSGMNAASSRTGAEHVRWGAPGVARDLVRRPPAVRQHCRPPALLRTGEEAAARPRCSGPGKLPRPRVAQGRREVARGFSP